MNERKIILKTETVSASVLRQKVRKIVKKHKTEFEALA